MLAAAAASGGLRSEPAWLVFGVLFMAWFALSARGLRAEGRLAALLFFCWLAAAALFSAVPEVSLYSLARYGLFAALFFCAAPADGKGWLRAITAIGAFAALVFVWQKASGRLPLGFIGANPNYSAAFAAAAFPAVLHAAAGEAWPRRLGLLALAALLGAGLAFSGSRGAMGAAFLAGAAGLLLSRSYRALAAYLAAAAAAAALLPAGALEGLLKLDDPRAFARPQLWGAALKAAAASPLLGWGPGLLERVFELFKFPYFDGVAYYWHSTRHAHSEIFNLAAEAGFPAALLFCAAAFSAFRRGLRGNPGLALALLAVFVQASADMVFYSGAVSLLFWGTAGILTAGESAGPRQGRLPALLLAGAVMAGLAAWIFAGERPRGARPGSYPEAALAAARLESLRAPMSPFPGAAAGGILLASGDAAGAAAAYRRALELEPNFASARLGLSAAFAAAGDRPGACAALELAVRSAGLKAETDYQRLMTALDAGEAARLGKELCGKKRTGGATAPGRKRR
jgi:O-antigen ligase